MMEDEGKCREEAEARGLPADRQTHTEREVSNTFGVSISANSISVMSETDTQGYNGWHEMEVEINSRKLCVCVCLQRLETKQFQEQS